MSEKVDWEYMKTEDADSYILHLLITASFSPTKTLLGGVGHHKCGRERKKIEKCRKDGGALGPGR